MNQRRDGLETNKLIQLLQMQLFKAYYRLHFFFTVSGVVTDNIECSLCHLGNTRNRAEISNGFSDIDMSNWLPALCLLEIFQGGKENTYLVFIHFLSSQHLETPSYKPQFYFIFLY